MGDAGPAPVQQQLFPPPPAFYSLYGPGADGSAERPFPPAPPPPVQGEYVVFGEIQTATVGDPPLHAVQLYKQTEDGAAIDFRAELGALHRELVAGVDDLFYVLEKQPSTYARSVEAIGAILRNMQHLTRLLRPIQARLSLAETLETEVKMRHESAAELNRLCDAALTQDKLSLLQRRLEELLERGGLTQGAAGLDALQHPRIGS